MNQRQAIVAGKCVQHCARDVIRRARGRSDAMRANAKNEPFCHEIVQARAVVLRLLQCSIGVIGN